MTTAQAVQVLESLQYMNGSHNPTSGDRVFDVTAFDTNGASVSAQSTVSVVPVNDAPCNQSRYG